MSSGEGALEAWGVAPRHEGFPGGSDDEESACNAGVPGSIPGSGRSPGGGQGNPLQYSCLENALNRGAWWATVHGVAKSQTRLKRLRMHPRTTTWSKAWRLIKDSLGTETLCPLCRRTLEQAGEWANCRNRWIQRTPYPASRVPSLSDWGFIQPDLNSGATLQLIQMEPNWTFVGFWFPRLIFFSVVKLAFLTNQIWKIEWWVCSPPRRICQETQLYQENKTNSQPWPPILPL